MNKRDEVIKNVSIGLMVVVVVILGLVVLNNLSYIMGNLTR